MPAFFLERTEEPGPAGKHAHKTSESGTFFKSCHPLETQTEELNRSLSSGRAACGCTSRAQGPGCALARGCADKGK